MDTHCFWIFHLAPQHQLSHFFSLHSTEMSHQTFKIYFSTLFLRNWAPTVTTVFAVLISRLERFLLYNKSPRAVKFSHSSSIRGISPTEKSLLRDWSTLASTSLWSSGKDLFAILPNPILSSSLSSYISY